MNREFITIVSGLPRSGTSMMMSALVAGGLSALTDNIRTADEDNPKGYFELEKVKELEHDIAWLEDARGKVIKVISALLKRLPDQHHYKIIFMRRNMDEILASQKQMLIRRGEPTDKVGDERMAEMFGKHLRDVEAWLEKQSNMDVLYVSYNEVLNNPAANVETINNFLGGLLDAEKMTVTVDRKLHRQRR